MFYSVCLIVGFVRRLVTRSREAYLVNENHSTMALLLLQRLIAGLGISTNCRQHQDHAVNQRPL